MFGRLRTKMQTFSQREGSDPEDPFLERAYLKAYPDVVTAVKQGAVRSGWQHYNSYGRKEGRHYHLSRREALIRCAEAEKSILEIGPFCQPTLTGDQVKFFDVLTTEQLIQRAKALGLSAAGVPFIHFVSPNGDLSVVNETFDAVISSHCIEHQPDLVLHLQQASQLLVDGGLYYLVIPDKRFCFDHFIAESSIAEIVEAHHSKRRLHTLTSVIEHRALTGHNSSQRHWAGDHGKIPTTEIMAERIRSAMDEFEAKSEQYIDVHAWQFTPQSFKRNIEILNAMNLVNLKPIYVGSEVQDRFEFTAILSKS